MRISDWSSDVCSSDLHVQRYTGELLDMIRDGKFDTVSLISHHAPLEDAAELYRHWHDEQDSCTKIVLKPGLQKGAIEAVQAMEPRRAPTRDTHRPLERDRPRNHTRKTVV